MILSAAKRLLRILPAAAFCVQVATTQASDVPYVPTPMNVVDAMLGLGAVGPGDFLIDLGSGDGRISIRAATRFGVRGLGVDLDDSLVRTARAAAQKAGVGDGVKFEARNLFDTDLGEATVITAYLLNSVNLRLRPQLFAQLKPGTRIVTHDFHFGDWQPDQKITIDVPDKAYGPPRSDIMLWVIPADFSGVWQWTLPGAGGDVRHEAQLSQKFQVLYGRAAAHNRPVLLADAQVRGDAVSFTLGDAGGVQRYSGRISGNTISGEVSLPGGGRSLPWQATRVRTGKMDIGVAGRGDRAQAVAAGSSIKEQ
ncbi:MAG: methyltransferase domain-containing protein [Burkholderiales bacterium]|nr:methyltransferase domain-containing protein [Burkholderiales bacterium]MDP2400332.1 methyltransferase domain-containing protein [Burkholderiales bacterium]